MNTPTEEGANPLFLKEKEPLAAILLRSNKGKEPTKEVRKVPALFKTLLKTVEIDDDQKTPE